MTRLPFTLLPLALVAGLFLAPALAQDPPTVEVFTVGYSPEELTVTTGTAVTFEWIGGTHSVTSDDGYTNAAGEQFDSGIRSTGDTFEFTFDEPGTYEYFCQIHSSASGTTQNGTIVVQQAGATPSPTPSDQPTGEPTGEPSPEPTGEPAQPSGEDPVADALAWSMREPAGGVTHAVVGTTNSFADSLASAVLQGSSSPLLLTGPDALDPRVAEELQRLGVSEVTILGGPAAISEAVQAELEAMGITVTRRFGPTRVETSVEIARDARVETDTVLIARSDGPGTAAFADSLAAGAAAAWRGWPVLLTPTDSLHPAVGQLLQDGAYQRAIVAGGTAAISDGVVAALTDLGLAVTRLAGPTRFSTARLLADLPVRGLPPPADDGGATTFAQDPTPSPIPDPRVIVEGTGDLAWASGFAAAMHAGNGLVLSAADVLPGPTVDGLLGVDLVLCQPGLPEAACEAARAASGIDAQRRLSAVMDGDQEVPATTGGASGQFVLWPTDVEGAVCYRATNLVALSGPVAAAHVHAGEVGVDGDVVIDLPLGLMEVGDFAGDYLGCNAAVDPATVEQVIADPPLHYVNLHTEANPGGEIRGQMTESAPVVATLNAESERPGPGDADGFGGAAVFAQAEPGRICYSVQVSEVARGADDYAAHIHRGGPEEAGPVVIPLVVGPEPFTTFSHCDGGVDQALLDEIAATPEAFYVNVHNAEFPDGAIRGQLGPRS